MKIQIRITVYCDPVLTLGIVELGFLAQLDTHKAIIFLAV